MPRTALTKTTALGPRTDVYTAGAADVTMTAADVGNKNSFVASNRDLIVVQNSGASSYTVTITSVVEQTLGRTGDIGAYTMHAGDICAFGPFSAPGWQQTDGSVYLEANNAAVKFGIIALPAI